MDTIAVLKAGYAVSWYYYSLSIWTDPLANVIIASITSPMISVDTIVYMYM